MATFKQGNHETINSRVLIGTQAAIFICDAWQMFIELSKANKFSPQTPAKLCKVF
jgi:hypothetical protein